ncbi:MAG TPA: cob(I)yrinic acid a,c-diamide adenosyltransferase [bacterium]
MTDEERPRPRRRGRRGGRRRRGKRSGAEAGGAAAPGARGPRIYTRAGDRGETGLIGGQRVPKDDPRVEAYGAVDELNAQLGAARAIVRDRDLEEVLDRLQNRLFDLGAELAAPKGAQKTPSTITAAEVQVLEGVIDLYQETLPPLREFILPAGSEIATALHVARTLCRRAERRVVTLHRRDALDAEILSYLNRLSDLLFVLARVANARAMIPDAVWKKAAPKKARTTTQGEGSVHPSPPRSRGGGAPVA